MARRWERLPRDPVDIVRHRMRGHFRQEGYRGCTRLGEGPAADVSDIRAARDERFRRVIAISELFYRAGGVSHRAAAEGQDQRDRNGNGITHLTFDH